MGKFLGTSQTIARGGFFGAAASTKLTALASVLSLNTNGGPFNHKGDGWWTPAFLAAAGGTTSGGSPVPANPTLGGFAVHGVWWCDRNIVGSLGPQLFIAVAGNAAAVAVFNSLSFTDRLGVVHNYLGTASGWDPGQAPGYSVWMAAAAAATTFPFDAPLVPPIPLNFT
jgi:hypothetical protein